MNLRACDLLLPGAPARASAAGPAPRDFDLPLVMAVAAVTAASPRTPPQPREASAVVRSEVVLVGDPEPGSHAPPPHDTDEHEVGIESAVLAAIDPSGPSSVPEPLPEAAPAPRAARALAEILPAPTAPAAGPAQTVEGSTLVGAETQIVVVHPELGEVELSLRLAGSEMDVVAVAADLTGAEALLHTEAALRAVVGAHGLRLRSLTARVRDRAGEAPGESPQGAEAARRRRFRLELVA
jgi:hypothetical protein